MSGRSYAFENIPGRIPAAESGPERDVCASCRPQSEPVGWTRAESRASVGATHARTLSARLAAEQVEAVDEVNHAVAEHAVVFRITAHGGADGAAHVALVAQDVVELHADGGGVALEEVLRNLRVPYQLVAVHA